MDKMGFRIYQKRTEAGMTMAELGEKVGVQPSAVNKWEKGDTQNIKRSVIAQMAALFHCSPSWLMGFDETADVKVTYESPNSDPVTLTVDKTPIMGQSSLRAQLYQAAAEVRPEDLSVAITVLQSLAKKGEKE